MKKVFVLLITVFALSGCSSEPKISDKNEFSISKYSLSVDSASIDGDDLKIFVNWKFGTDEDSMKQEKFASTGILFSAKQNGVELKEDLTDSGIYNNVYEMNEGSVTPNFTLNNKKDPVDLTIFDAVSEKSKEIKIELE